MRIEVSVLWDEAVQKWRWGVMGLDDLGPVIIRDGYARFRGSAWRQAVGAVADLKAEKERNDRNSARNHKFEMVI